MKICMVCEGCYPYVVGGVSSWINSIIRSFPEHEFIILALISRRDAYPGFVYDLPENISMVQEVYLEDLDWGNAGQEFRLGKDESAALRGLFLDENVDWDTIFSIFEHEDISINRVLMGKTFLQAVADTYEEKFSDEVFTDFLWTMRSMYLPLFHVLQTKVPEADLYHCVATGYAGILGVMAQRKYHCGLLVTEHGIYTREREEELVKARWVKGIYKDMWIDQFRKMSMVAYKRADRVTSLFEHARELQEELGCPKEKQVVIPNGVNVERFANVPGKTAEDEEWVNIGAVLRVTPIKDVKTLLRAFSYAKKRLPTLKLWLMGPNNEDEKYAEECYELVDAMHIEDVVFTGRINVTEYIGRMDFTILTSISEGQPLTILEGYAAHKPAIATDVGNCSGLIHGERDDFGDAGILTHIMNIDEIANAMVKLGRDPALTDRMGEAGYRRVTSFYKISDMEENYRKLYNFFEDRKWYGQGNG